MNTSTPDLTTLKVIKPIRFDDLPTLLAPYAVSCSVYVYMRADGHVTASRLRKQGSEEDLVLVLAPRTSYHVFLQ